MKQYFRFVIICFLITVVVPGISRSADYVAVEEHLGVYLPDDLIFTLETGETSSLVDLIDKPTVIAPVYYNCPGLCTPIMDGLVRLLNFTDLEIGKDFDVLNISFHEDENPELATLKKNNYSELIENQKVENHWHFLTGDSVNIQRLLKTLGYSVLRQGEDILHPAAIMIVSPSTKIVKYIHGTKFNPIEFKMAVNEAVEEKTTPTISRMMKMCFNYEPDGRNKQKSVTILGFIIMLCTAMILVAIYPPLNNKN